MSINKETLPLAACGTSIGDKIRAALAVGRVRWSMLALVFFATTLNYIDRAALGVLQPILSQAMHWTAEDYANINFWFQVGYAIGFAAQGRFIDKVGVRRAFLLAVLLWSVAAGAHGLVSSAAGFMVCRFFLGLTEAANYPACVKATRLWFPAGERAMATGIFNAGTNVGAMLTPLMLPLILQVWGWRAVFFVVAALGIVWVVFWFYLYWLPPFLNQQYKLGISVTQIGLPLLVIYFTADIGSIAGGALSSWMIGRGMAAVRARLLSMLICALCIVPVVLAVSADSLWEAVIAIALAVGAHQAWTANIWSLVMDYTPKQVVSSVFGFGGMVGAVGGMFMTQLVGYVLTVTHNRYEVLFIMIPSLYFIALTWLHFMAPRRVEQDA